MLRRSDNPGDTEGKGAIMSERIKLGLAVVVPAAAVYLLDAGSASGVQAFNRLVVLCIAACLVAFYRDQIGIVRERNLS